MQGIRFGLVAALVMLLGTVAVLSAYADPGTVVTDTQLNQAMTDHADRDAASRQQILDWLDRDEVGGAAAQAGLDLDRVRGAVSVLSGDELREVAAQAQDADRQLAGGDEKIVIGSTVLIIVLLIVIILIAAD